MVVNLPFWKPPYLVFCRILVSIRPPPSLLIAASLSRYEEPSLDASKSSRSETDDQARDLSQYIGTHASLQMRRKSICSLVINKTAFLKKGCLVELFSSNSSPQILPPIPPHQSYNSRTQTSHQFSALQIYLRLKVFRTSSMLRHSLVSSISDLLASRFAFVLVVPDLA